MLAVRVKPAEAVPGVARKGTQFMDQTPGVLSGIPRKRPLINGDIKVYYCVAFDPQSPLHKYAHVTCIICIYFI